MAGTQQWCVVTVVGPDGTLLARCPLEGRGLPDIEAVNEVARLALLGSRLGGGVVLTETTPAMRELLELAALPVEVQG